MTKEEAIENLKLVRLNAAMTGAASFKKAIDLAIVALSKPSLPSNLDEAAFNYAEACQYDGAEKLLCVEHFKAAAEWMAGQGVKIGETEIYLEYDGGEPPYDGTSWLELTGTEYPIPKDKFKDGDKVDIILRKKQ